MARGYAAVRRQEEVRVADRFRRLIVMRHAKSSWESDAASDHQRPLNERGRSDAPRIAQRLVELGWVPDRVISSDSARTQETWARMADTLPAPQSVLFTRRFYLGGPDVVVDMVRDEPEDGHCLLLMGHNPGWEETVEWLSGEAIRMTTANAVLLQHELVPWSRTMAQDAWSLVDVLRPKELT